MEKTNKTMAVLRKKTNMFELAGAKHTYTIIERKDSKKFLVRGANGTIAAFSLITCEREEKDEDYAVYFIEVLDELIFRGDKERDTIIAKLKTKHGFGKVIVQEETPHEEIVQTDRN